MKSRSQQRREKLAMESGSTPCVPGERAPARKPMTLADFAMGGELYNLKTKAEAGDAESQFEFGWAHYKGTSSRSFPQDFAKAVEWWRKASAQGYLAAQLQLGLAQLEGNALEQDVQTGIKEITRLADQGYPEAQGKLGAIYFNGQEGVAKDFDSAFHWLELAAKNGHVGSQGDLGVCYYMGRGVEKDGVKGVECLTKAADQGDIRAMLNLIEVYNNDFPWEANPAKASEWRIKAANAGHAQSQFELGKKNLDEGDGVSAAAWLKQAADQGHVLAKLELGQYCFDLGKKHDEERDYISAGAWFKKAADQGHVLAKLELGQYYEAEKGGLKAFRSDIKLCYIPAAQQGNSFAKARLAHFVKLEEAELSARIREQCQKFGHGQQSSSSSSSTVTRQYAPQGDYLRDGYGIPHAAKDPRARGNKPPG